MEYQIIINLLDDTANQPSKFRTRNCVEINDESRGAYNNNDDGNNSNKNIKFKTSIMKSNLYDYSDAYILFKGTITFEGAAAEGAGVNTTTNKVIFKNCAPFTNCLTKINNTQVDDAQDIDIAILCII